MEYPKLKQEMYLNVGGINEKASEYVTDDKDVLDLRNFSFARPGGWVSRPGYSLYINTSLVSKITGLYEYEKLNGESYLVTSAGTTLLSYVNTTQTGLRNDLAGTPVDMLTFVNYLWGADGKVFWKFNGSYSSYWQLPLLQPDILHSQFSVGENATYTTTVPATDTGGQTVWGSTTTPASYDFTMAYVNERGIVGPVYLSTDDPFGRGWNWHTVGASWSARSGGQWLLWGFTVPAGFGISQVAVFMRGSGESVPSTLNDLQGYSLYMIGMTTFGGVTTYFTKFNHFNSGPTLLEDADILNRYGASVAGQGNTWYVSSASIAPIEILDQPKYLELYNNMLFVGGFTTTPSVTRVSDIGEPESVLFESFFETRTNDGDKIIGYSVFQGSLLIFKERSISVVGGDSPDTLSQQEVTTNFGCLNNRTIVQFDNRLFFLDSDGIAEYNGINTDIASHKIDSTTQRINQSVAKTSACAVHVKDRNEVWFAVPLDSSQVNNAVLVYDYLVDGWTIYEGFSPYSMSVLNASLPRREVMFGNYTGILYAFGQSMVSDAGATINWSFKTKFHKRIGDSSTEVFRRFYLNNAVPSVTTPVTVQFYPNYGSGVSLTDTMYTTYFQSMINLGLVAASMSVKVSGGSNTDQITINGYTIESRYLRQVSVRQGQ